MAKLKPTLAITKSTFPNHLERFLQTKAMADESAARLKTQRDTLIAFVEKSGIVDDKGHQWTEAEGIGTAKRERRVSNVFDSDFAEDWLKENNLWKECTTTITVLDEDAIVALIYTDKIPQDVADQMYTERASFAFKVTAF